MTKNSIKTGSRNCQVLILTPTRELASQIQDNIKNYTKYLNITSMTIFGGVSINPQIKSLKIGIDIIIATPGRLLDHIKQKTIKFDQLGFFVLDEADRMLDMGFLKDVKSIISFIPRKRQTLLFSATMPKEIDNLAMSMLRNPKKVEITPESTTVEKIDQSLMTLAKAEKKNLLVDLLSDKSFKKVLVFSRTKHGADRIVKQLDKKNIKAYAIHGNKSQGAREKALKAFTNESVRILIATDIAARGIDVKGITHVINYNLPEDPESYVHRIGRTARAGTKGIAISFCDETELKLLRGIEKIIKLSIPKDTNHYYHVEIENLKKMSLENTEKPHKQLSKNKHKKSSRRNR